MRKILFLIFIFWNETSYAQVTGSSIVCPAYIYTYSAAVAGATSYTWTVPNGWTIISGQGTSQINVFCNANIGTVCADAYDNSGTFISQSCQSVSWGGGNGWDAIYTTVLPCLCDPVAILVMPNSSSCPGNCGSGSQSPNAFFAVYNNPWPGGNYLGPADGVAAYPQPSILNFTNFYVYQIDTTWGINNAVLITGSACTITTHNIVTVSGCSNLILSVTVTPDTVCVGDTFIATGNTFGNSPFNFNWNSTDTNITFLGNPPFSSQVQGVLTGMSTPPVLLQYSEVDQSGCIYLGHGYIIPAACNASPVSDFTTTDTVICPSSCINFTNRSTNGTSYHWLFPGANPASDTSFNPQNICYAVAGVYDVTLITSGQNSVDTLTLHQFITVHNINAPAIIQHGDTLFVDSNYVSYQWYEDSVLIPGVTSFYLVPGHGGNFSVHVVDSNGCASSSIITHVVVSANDFKPSVDKINVSYFDGILQLNNYDGITSRINVDVMSSMGQLVFSKSCLLNGPRTRINLSMQFPPGIYFVRLYTADSFYTKELLVN